MKCGFFLSNCLYGLIDVHNIIKRQKVIIACYSWILIIINRTFLFWFKYLIWSFQAGHHLKWTIISYLFWRLLGNELLTIIETLFLIFMRDFIKRVRFVRFMVLVSEFVWIEMPLFYDLLFWFRLDVFLIIIYILQIRQILSFVIILHF